MRAGISMSDTTIGCGGARGVPYANGRLVPDGLTWISVLARVKDTSSLPVAMPPEAVTLQGLRIGKGGHGPDLPCFVGYSDRHGEVHEFAISLAEMLAIVNYLNETRQCLPLRVRLDS